MDRISIIVPVYNAEKYLRECLDSLLNQTYSDVEIILVDDGSTDESIAICDEYDKKYYRVKVLHQENAGQNAARFAGLKMSSGKYIMFVDADDWVAENICEVLLSLFWSADIDYTRVGAVNVLLDNRQSREKILMPGIYRCQELYEKIAGDVFGEWKLASSLTAALFQRELIFKEFDNVDLRVNYGEDGIVLLGYLLSAKKANIGKEYGYYYRKNLNSVTHTHKKSNLESQKYLFRCVTNRFNRENIDCLWYRNVKWLTIINLLYGGYDAFDDYPGIFPYPRVQRKDKIVIYGFGLLGVELHKWCGRNNVHVMGIVDQQWEEYQKKGMYVKSPDEILSINYDYILIAITKPGVAQKVAESLENIGIPRERICQISQRIIDSEYTENLLRGFLNESGDDVAASIL